MSFQNFLVVFDGAKFVSLRSCKGARFCRSQEGFQYISPRRSWQSALCKGQWIRWHHKPQYLDDGQQVERDKKVTLTCTRPQALHVNGAFRVHALPPIPGAKLQQIEGSKASVRALTSPSLELPMRAICRSILGMNDIMIKLGREDRWTESGQNLEETWAKPR